MLMWGAFRKRHQKVQGGEGSLLKYHLGESSFSPPMCAVRQNFSAPCLNNPISSFRIAAAQAALANAAESEHAAAGPVRWSAAIRVAAIVARYLDALKHKRRGIATPVL
jgi:hypothetical protein